MKKHIALGIAAAVLGASGVASAVVSYDDLTSAGSSESSFETTTDHLAANCWIVTGAEQDAHCTTSVDGVDLPAIPDLPGVGLDQVSGLVDTAEGVAGEAINSVPKPAELVAKAQSLAGRAQGLVGDAVPNVCNLPIPAAVELPVPASIFSAGMALFHRVEGLVMDNPALNALPPVNLPVDGVPTADEVIDLTQGQIECLAEHFGGSLPIDIPAICSVEGGLPSAVKSALPGEISGLLGPVAQELANFGINIGGSNVGVSCDLDAAAGAIPGEVTGAVDTAVDAVSDAPGSVTGQVGAVADTAGNTAGHVADTATDTAGHVAGTATDTAGDAVETVTGITGTVTGTVDGALNTVTGVVGGLLPTSGPECSASANASGGLFGGLTAVLSGGCK